MSAYRLASIFIAPSWSFFRFSRVNANDSLNYEKNYLKSLLLVCEHFIHLLVFLDKFCSEFIILLFEFFLSCFGGLVSVVKVWNLSIFDRNCVFHGFIFFLQDTCSWSQIIDSGLESGNSHFIVRGHIINLSHGCGLLPQTYLLKFFIFVFVISQSFLVILLLFSPDYPLALLLFFLLLMQLFQWISFTFKVGSFISK